MGFLAAVPALLSGISTVTDLFNSGKKVVETVTGKPSTASSPEELQDEISSMTPDQQEKWAEVMTKKVELYELENERLDIEQGQIDSNITSKLSQDAADEIALMRQTTRPWAVRMMVHYMLFPFYLVCVDTAQHLLHNWIIAPLSIGITPFNTFTYVFGAQDLSSFISQLKEFTTGTIPIIPQTSAALFYMEALPWATSIVLGYMGLRQVDKWKGTAGEGKPSLLAQTTGLVGKITNLFKK